MNGPSPDDRYPMKGFPRVAFLKNFITRSNIVVGDYTYYDDPTGPEKFEMENVLYHYERLGDKLAIGKFCAIAQGARFIMNGANHRMSGYSTYPFSIFGQGWERVTPELKDLPYKGDTVVMNDVWLGYDCLIMPGVRIGDGAIVASRSVVTGDVPPYAIVGGNPARVIRRRFTGDVIGRLEELKWWDWDIEKISANLEMIAGGDPKLFDLKDR